MMAISFSCSCGRAFTVDDSRAGNRGRCPECGGMFKVPVSQIGHGPAASQPTRPVQGDFVACPSCGKVGQIPPTFQGKVVTCKRCATKFVPPAIVSNMTPPPPPLPAQGPIPVVSQGSTQSQSPSDVPDLGISAYVPPPRPLASRPARSKLSLSNGLSLLLLIGLGLFLAGRILDGRNSEFEDQTGRGALGSLSAMLLVVLIAGMFLLLILIPLIVPVVLSRRDFLSMGRWIALGVFFMLFAALFFLVTFMFALADNAKGVTTLPMMVYSKAILESDYAVACTIAVVNIALSLGLFSLYRYAAARAGLRN